MSLSKLGLAAAVVGVAVVGASMGDGSGDGGAGDGAEAAGGWFEPGDMTVTGDAGVITIGGADAAPDAGAGDASCVDPLPMPPASPQGPATVGAGCYADRFFVEVRAEHGDLPPAFEGMLHTRLDGKKAQVLDWVCPDNDLVCRDVTNPLPLAVRSVLTADRAWSIEFDVPVREDKLCLAVDGIRAAAKEAIKIVAPGAPTPFVGRQCAMRIMGGSQSQPSPEMLHWHLDAMGVQPGGGEPGPGVAVVVLDTGIRPEVGDTLGVTALADELEAGGYDPAATIHPHGTHMALLVRQVAPMAEIYDLRVLDENGHGAITDLAAALDQVKYSDYFEEGPLIVNLSLGWAPELGRPRTLEGPGCVVQEDPVGESVRWTLAELADRDASHPTLVVAAAGNRPHRADLVDGLYADAFAVARDVNGPLPAHTTCNTPAPPSPDWFYPGEWNRRPTCDAAGDDPRYLTWAVGATDSRELPGALTIDAPETPVVGPGEHVYVEHGYSDPWPSATCLGDGFPNRLTLPAAITGSSASTALASGVAAAAQSRLLGNGAPALSGPGMQRLVWLTGEWITGYGGQNRAPWRPDPGSLVPLELSRLSWCRMFHAVEQASMPGGDFNCADLVACADPAQRPAAVIDEGVEVDCRGYADVCLGAAACNPPNPSEPQWDPGYQPPAVCLDPAACPLAWSDSAPCELLPTGCDYERTIEQHSAAPLGPQPSTPGCPDCAFRSEGYPIWPGSPGNLDPDDSILYAELNPLFQTGTTFNFPHLVVDYYTPTGSYQRSYVPVPQSAPWQPGDYVKVTDMPDLPAGTGHKLGLWLYIDPPGTGNSTVDISPVRLEY